MADQRRGEVDGVTTMTRERPVRAVVIDDTSDIRDLLRLALSASGMDVVGEAGDGREGVDLVRDSRPDVVILDLAMPVMDGYQAAEELKHSAVTRHIPIIAVTAQPGARESARISGCDAFLAKPCMPQLLWCEISLLLGTERAV